MRCAVSSARKGFKDILGYIHSIWVYSRVERVEIVI